MGFEYLYLKFDPVFYLLAQAHFDTFQPIHCRIYNFRSSLIEVAIDVAEIDCVFGSNLFSSSASFSCFTLAVLMREVSCVGYTPRS